MEVEILMERFLILLPLLLLFGCSDSGQIKGDDCESICGGVERLELAQHECGRIDNVRDAESCRLAAAVAWNTCHSRCEFE